MLERQKELLRLFNQPVALNDGVNSSLGDSVNEGVNSVLAIIANHPGWNARQLAVAFGKSLPTTEQHVRKLKQQGLIEFRGAPKNGGYFTKG